MNNEALCAERKQYSQNLHLGKRFTLRAKSQTTHTRTHSMTIHCFSSLIRNAMP